MKTTFLEIIANVDPVVAIGPGHLVALALGSFFLMVFGSIALAVLFYFFAKACFTVTSFKKLLNDLRTGKEKNRCLRILFIGSSGIFKPYYEFQLRMMGDRGMVFLIRVLGVICAIISVASLLGLVAFIAY